MSSQRGEVGRWQGGRGIRRKSIDRGRDSVPTSLNPQLSPLTQLILPAEQRGAEGTPWSSALSPEKRDPGRGQQGRPGSGLGRPSSQPLPHSLDCSTNLQGLSLYWRGSGNTPHPKVTSVYEVTSSKALTRTLVGTHTRAHTREHTREQGTAAATPALLLLGQVPRQRALEEGAFQSKVDVPRISPTPPPNHRRGQSLGSAGSRAAKHSEK